MLDHWCKLAIRKKLNILCTYKGRSELNLFFTALVVHRLSPSTSSSSTHTPRHLSELSLHNEDVLSYAFLVAAEQLASQRLAREPPSLHPPGCPSTRCVDPSH